jgi:hypothetical protein
MLTAGLYNLAIALLVSTVLFFGSHCVDHVVISALMLKNTALAAVLPRRGTQVSPAAAPVFPAPTLAPSAKLVAG